MKGKTIGSFESVYVLISSKEKQKEQVLKFHKKVFKEDQL